MVFDASENNGYKKSFEKKIRQKIGGLSIYLAFSDVLILSGECVANPEVLVSTEWDKKLWL